MAYVDTAEKTGAVTGIRWGGGVWINYLMLTVWSMDAGVAWIRGAGAWAGMHRWPLRWIFAFIWSQGAVVFPKGPLRWGAAFVLVLLGAWVWHQWRQRRLMCRSKLL